MSNQKELKVFIYYFIQNDSFDSLAEPNVCALPGKYSNVNDITANLIYKNFPVKFDNLYLRFFYEDTKQNLKLWLDYPPSASVPVYNDKIYVKALRLPKDVPLKFKNDEIFQKKGTVNEKKKTIVSPKRDTSSPNIVNTAKFNSDNGTGSKNTKIEQNRTTHSKSPIRDPHYEDILNGVNGNKTFNSTTTQKKDNIFNPDINRNIIDGLNFEFVEGVSENTENNLNDLINKNVNNNKKQTQEKNGKKSLLDEDIFSSYGNPSSKGDSSDGSPTKQEKNKSSNNIFDMGLNFDLSGSNIKNENPLNDMNRQNSNKSNNQIDNIPENLSEDETSERVDKIITEWSKVMNEKKNLRMMLATLYEVWNPEYWKDISRERMLTDDSFLNTQYRVAMKQLHPDKNSTKEFKMKYTATQLFYLIDKANKELQK